MKQRSSFAIVSLILEAIAKSEPAGGITKTKIMQNVMLNYKRANRYCYQMLESGLISYNSETRTFHITEKGRMVLHNSMELAQYIAPINQLMNKYRYDGDETNYYYYYYSDNNYPSPSNENLQANQQQQSVSPSSRSLQRQ
ncbi:MAG: winged helix-turn-helix domain-containing protein [Thermoproteota archaeon]|nr:winged helix-turn-helix domain-containing protein [Thermoproteota archaeon]